MITAKSARESLQESLDAVAYWTRQRAVRTEPAAKADAGARLTLWKQQVPIREERLAKAELAAHERAASARAAKSELETGIVDCGSGHHYGICPECGRGHGRVLMRNGKFTDYVTR